MSSYLGSENHIKNSKLGGKRLADKMKIVMQERIEKYNKNPKLCIQCSTAIPYKGHKQKKFCNHSCCATYSNIRKERKLKLPKINKRQLIIKEKFINGEISDRNTLKSHLRKIVEYKCAICKLDTWQNKPISLQLDHIDGNAGNNFPTNLRFLCPTCHSQTEFYAGKNRGNGRKSRGISRH